MKLNVALAVAMALFLFRCGNEDIKSTCVTGEACEIHILHLCECCEANEVDACKADRQEACATGKLGLGQTAEECAETNVTWDEYKAAGKDPCAQLNTDPAEQCQEKLMNRAPE